jgi:hypothetical protein
MEKDLTAFENEITVEIEQLEEKLAPQSTAVILD